MGYKMPIRNTANMIDRVSRDGREFGHVIESARDSILAGAENIEFGVYGLSDPEKPVVVKRRIADDGSGMSLDVFSHVYSGFAESATTKDFHVELDEELVTTHVSLLAATAVLSDMHARYGLGGRASLASWNPLGVVTVTAQDGVALMSWMYRAISGDLMMRQWIESGRRTHVAAPYTEPEFLYKSDLEEDIDFSTMLMIKSGVVERVEDAAALIAEMDDDDVIVNPLDGYEWDGNVVPRWVIDRYEVEGDNVVAYRADGTKAHGTVKLLLGDNPKAHTALTGDPYFPNEADYKKYNGAPNMFFLDLTPWNVVVSTINTSAEGKYSLVGMEDKGKYEISGDYSNTEERPTGRKQSGVLQHRLIPPLAADRKTLQEDQIEFKKVLDLGPRFGKALVLLRKDTKTTGEGMWATSRHGVTGIVYGNEVHGIGSDNTDTKDRALRLMGISSMAVAADRVSILLFLPRATDTTEGIYQTHARDALKWKGLDALPMTGDNGINVAMRKALDEQAPEFLALLKGALLADDEIDVTPKRAKTLWNKVKNMTTAPKRLKAAEAKAAVEAGAPGLVETEGGSESGTEAGQFSQPGDNERPVCPECGLKIHADDCSRKPKGSGGGGGGTKGPVTRLRPGDGPRRGRPSKAKVTKTETEDVEDAEVETTKDEPPCPPIFVNVRKCVDPTEVDSMVRTLGIHPLRYERPTVFKQESPTEGMPTGTIYFDPEHPLIQRLIGIGLEADKDREETELIVLQWFKTRLTEFLFGNLSVADTKMGLAKETLSFDGIGDALMGASDAAAEATDETARWIWTGFVAFLYFEETAITSAVHAKAAAATKTRKPRAKKAAPTVGETAAEQVAKGLEDLGGTAA